MPAEHKESEIRLRTELLPYHPEWIDGSKRGSGMNAVWRIRYRENTIILKTYDSRRNPVAAILTEFGNLLTGLTSYSAEARCQTERACLLAWAEAGFQVPALVDFHPSAPLPVFFLAMEDIKGRLLLDVLADQTVGMEQRTESLARFTAEWASRHAEAMRRGDAWLLQEHGSFGHVFVDGKRFVTFDLEVAYRKRRNVELLVCREIIAYLRSIGRRFPVAEADAWFGVIAAAYPDKSSLRKAAGELLESVSPVRRAWHRLARLSSAARHPNSKYGIARRLAATLDKGDAKP
jgi:tRNA A-37 threonylcarbamoyl transferase component Bud32